MKLVSIRDIAAKLNAIYKKNMFDDVNFFDLKTFVDDKTNKWVYRIVFMDNTKENTVLFFDYDAHNGNFIKTKSFTMPEGFEWH
jgi:S-adenosylmethionine:diacylglycerol 3-amino-3-carboxypropyl transferase